MIAFYRNKYLIFTHNDFEVLKCFVYNSHLSKVEKRQKKNPFESISHTQIRNINEMSNWSELLDIDELC